MAQILFCEDDVLTRKVVMHTLKKESFTTNEFENGALGLDFLKSNTVDLVLTDIHMPKLDGLGLIEAIRNELKLHVPIIILTNIGNETTVLKAFEIGADDYLIKPFEPEDLIIRIKKVLQRVGN